MTMNYNYKVGGGLDENDPSYVSRKADTEFYELLRRREFGFIFNSRQMGKTSLLNRAMKKLKEEGFACAKIDLNEVSFDGSDAEQWYTGIAYILAKNLNIFSQLEDFLICWDRYERLSPVQRFQQLLNDIILPKIPGNIIIFIDEIDRILTLKFSCNDFFALIRSFYDGRSENTEYHRLTFAFIGVTTPSDLIDDKKRTPFNIGKAVQLSGFQEKEMEPLARGLMGRVHNIKEVIHEVVAWTGGQPFLTQKLCQLISQELSINSAASKYGNPEINTLEWVGEIVQEKVINNWEALDEPVHLRTIRDRLINNEQNAGRLLGLYQQILEQGSISSDGSPEQIDLQLTGLVVKRGNKLEVYNLIYKEIFNRDWLDKELTKLRPAFYAEAIKAWLATKKKDISYLLRGQALQDALTWAASRSLSKQDYQFLTASQELDNRQAQLEKLEAEIALEIEREKKEVAEQANRILNRAYKKARLIIAVSLLISVSTLILAGIFINKQQTAEKVTQLEQASNSLSTLFRAGELQALISSIKNAELLQKLVKSDRSIQNYPTLSPLYTLQQILNKIHLRNEFNSQQGEIKNIVFAPYGEKIVSSGRDGTVRVWNFSGKLLTQWQADKQESLNHLTISSDNKQLATAGLDGKVRLWNLAGKPLEEWMAHSVGGVNYLNFSSDVRKVATAGGDGMIRLWNLSGKQLAQWKAVDGEFDGVRKVVISPNGEEILSVGDDGIAKLWNLSGQKSAQFEPLQNQGISSVSFSPDGKTIVTAETLSKKDNTLGLVRLWDISGKQIKQWDAHQGKVTDISFSPDDQQILTTGGDDFRIKVWNLSGKSIADLQGHNSGILSGNFSANNQYIVSADKRSFIRLWDLSEKSVLSLQVNQDDINDVSFSPDGQKIVTVGDDQVLRVWMLSGKEIYKEKRKGKLRKVNFSPDGQRIAAIGDYNTVRLWNSIGQPAHLLTVDNGSITSVIFSPNGQSIATTGSDGTAKIWSLTGQEKLRLKGHQGTVWDIDFSKDGKLIATAGEDGTVRLWNTSGQERIQLSGHHGKVRSIKFSPNDKKIVTAGDDGIVRLWDFQGKLEAYFNTYQLKINRVSFSPDGELIATAGIDGTVRLWDLRGRQLNEFQGKGEPFWGLNFSPDGQYIASAEGGGTVYVWRVGSFNNLLDSSCKWLKYYQNSQQKTLNGIEVCQRKN